MKKSIRVAATAAALSLAACGGEGENENKADTDGTHTATPTEAQSPNGAATGAETPTADKEVSDIMSERDAFRAENLAYLDENQKKEGVQVTGSGLQYRVIDSGDGDSPTAEHYVTVHYAGRLIDGTEFDSSYKRGEPATFPAGRLIPGWTEALQMMQEGDKWELVIPAEIGYGESGAGNLIPSNATLVFDVELIEVLSIEQVQKMAEEKAAAYKGEQLAYLETNAGKDGITVTESGLQYRVIEEGNGKTPTETSMVTVHYAGTLINGAEFDSSYKRGEPIQFPLDGVIKGWTEGVQLMKEGAKYEFFIPYDLAYGERGTRNIPPFSTLIFTVELISVDS